MNNISLFLVLFSTLGPFSTGIYYKVKISSKVTDLDSSFRLLRLVRFEFFWIQVYPLVSVSGSLTEFSLFSPLLNFKGVFQRIFSLWFTIAEWFFPIDSLSFYSALLGFLVYHCLLPFVALGIKTNVASATLVAGPFLIFSLFSPFEVSPLKVPSWPSFFGRS